MGQCQEDSETQQQEQPTTREPCPSETPTATETIGLLHTPTSTEGWALPGVTDAELKGSSTQESNVSIDRPGAAATSGLRHTAEVHPHGTTLTIIASSGICLPVPPVPPDGRPCTPAL